MAVGLFPLIAASAGRADDAARLLGYSRRAPIVGTEERLLRERARDAIENALTASRIATLGVEGERMSESDALELALGHDRARDRMVAGSLHDQV